MKKSEITQLTHIIEHLVAREVRKQLPVLLTETLRSMKSSVVTEAAPKIQTIQEQVDTTESPIDFKASLRDLFAGTPVMRTPELPPEQRPTIKYAKDPILNQILNETVGDLRTRERRVGPAAFMGGFDPGAPSAIPFSELPVSTPPTLLEGQESNHAPMAAIPDGLSALDFKNHVAPAVQKALTRNYSATLKLIDQKRGKI